MTETTCPGCDGTGDCQSCGGEDEHRDTCDSCGDTGECQECDGTGEIDEETETDA